MKTIVCYGDSNTWGFQPHQEPPSLSPARFDCHTRWPGILQELLGSGYKVEEEGLNGRTTAFDDFMNDNRNGLRYVDCCMLTNMPADMVVLMLGTNDTKEYLGKDAFCISKGLEQIVIRMKTGGYGPGGASPEILIVSPAALRDNIAQTWPGPEFGNGCLEKAQALAPLYAKVARENGCYFLDAAAYVKASRDDAVHLDAESHKLLAKVIYQEILKIENK